MKKLAIVCLCAVLALSLFACAKKDTAGKPETMGAETTPQQTDTAENYVPTADEDTALIQLDSIDYNEADGTVLANITHMAFVPAPEGEPETAYQIIGGESKQLPINKEALIDFPLADNEAQTVTLLVDEFVQEFMTYTNTHDTKLLFIYEEANGELTKLVHFYTP
ncbi:MAG: hypothetical protein RRZ24_01615 [Clostridia bacterium]